MSKWYMDESKNITFYERKALLNFYKSLVRYSFEQFFPSCFIFIFNRKSINFDGNKNKKNTGFIEFEVIFMFNESHNLNPRSTPRDLPCIICLIKIGKKQTQLNIFFGLSF